MDAEKLCVTNTVLRIYAYWRVLEFLHIYTELFPFCLIKFAYFGVSADVRRKTPRH